MSASTPPAFPHAIGHYCVGLMSGTSLDGVDGVLLHIDPSTTESAYKLRQVTFASAPIPKDLRAELLALNTPGGHNELHRAALATNALMQLYATVVHALCQQSDLPPKEISIIGAHGQTIRHQPQQFDGTGYTIQLCNGALLSELTGIAVACDFRTRDVAAGGQGAPLVPAFHQALWGSRANDMAVLNLGGMANISLIQSGQPVQGFDCGPANVLLDYWCAQHTGQPYDAGGAWAAQGQAHPVLLQQMLGDTWVQQAPPKSTGRDYFNPAWLERQLQGYASLSAVDVQATLTQLTVQCVALHIKNHAASIQQLVVCGGGVCNKHIMQGLAIALPTLQVQSSHALGIDPQALEACAFAWLASKALTQQAIDLSTVTGTNGARPLGCIYRN